MTFHIDGSHSTITIQKYCRIYDRCNNFCITDCFCRQIWLTIPDKTLQARPFKVDKNVGQETPL